MAVTLSGLIAGGVVVALALHRDMEIASHWRMHLIVGQDLDAAAESHLISGACRISNRQRACFRRTLIRD